MASRIDVVKRQRDEAKLLAHLHHHNIVRVFDLLEIHGRPTVLMEYVSGVDTQVLLNQVGRFPTRAAIQVVAAVASALDAAYNAPNPNTGTPLHVVHRDIKPANVLISGHGGVKILDFGVARGEFEREGQTMDTVLGTAAFIAPEQWLHCETSHATDIYALGVTLLALLGLVHDQRAPLDVGSHKALVQTRLKALGAQESEPEIREVLTSLISKMLAFDPTVRPAARDVEETCLSLMDRPTGGGLVTFARTQVPPLILEREKRFATDSLLPSFKYSQGNIDISGPLADEFGSVPEQTFEWNSLGPEDSHEPKNDRESDQRHAMSPKGEHWCTDR